MALTLEGGGVWLFRAIWESPVFRNEQEAACFLWMLSKAQWRGTTLQSRAGPIQLAKGQLVISERSLSARFGMHRNTLRNLLQRLVDTGVITLKRDHHQDQFGTICTIQKYEQFQRVDLGFAEQSAVFGTSSGTTSGPVQDQLGTTREEGLRKEKKEESGQRASHVACGAGEAGASTRRNRRKAALADAAQPSLLACAEVVSLPPDEIRAAMVMWNEFAANHELPGVDLDPALRSTQARRITLRRVLKEVGGLEGFGMVLGRVAQLPFMLGAGARGWRCNLDYLLRPRSIGKILHGEYDSRDVSRLSDDAFAEVDQLMREREPA